ncbi:hypothetical protein GCM10027592_46550 [Spirosoma flavus]
MEALKQIANVAGYSGLYRILKPGRAGVIVESLDDKKAKTMMGPTARVSVLNDISIYVTDDDEQSIPLSNVLTSILDKYGDTLPVNPKSENNELADFMEAVVPNYDVERVRSSDIKKLVSWYSILRQYAPDVFDVAAEEPKTEEVAEAEPSDVIEEPVAEAPKKQKTQKA